MWQAVAMCVQAAECAAREAQQQSSLAHEQARAAAAAEGAARALAHDADGRAATAAQEARHMHDAVVACMEGMRATETIMGTVMDRTASQLLRIEFAGADLCWWLWHAFSAVRCSRDCSGRNLM